MGISGINEHWFEFSKQTLDRFGAEVEDPTREHRYSSQPDWHEIADSLRPFLFQNLDISEVSPRSAMILNSWLTEPPVANICFKVHPESHSQWQVTNGRHRLTGVMRARPDLNIPVYWSTFESENGPYSEQICGSKAAQIELAEQNKHSYLPKTQQNDRFLNALTKLATKKIQKPAPQWPASKVKIQGRAPDHAFLSDNEIHSVFVWKSNGNALIIVNSARVFYHDSFSSDWGEIQKRIPELEYVIADCRKFTVVSEVRKGFRADVHYTDFTNLDDLSSIHFWGPRIQICICRVGMRVTKAPKCLPKTDHFNNSGAT